MAEGLSKGDRVRWRSGRGTASGTVERVITGRGKVGGRTITGSKKDPRYVVKNAETGKTTVLKRGSVSKAAGRRAPSRKAPAGKAAAKPAAGKAPKARQPLRRPSRSRRWAAAALVAAAAVAAAIVLIDGDDGGEEATEEAPGVTTTEPTTTGPSEETIQAVSEALQAQPLALRGVETIPRQRIGDDQEQFASQFDRTYRTALSDLEALQSATGEPAGSSGVDPAGGDEVEQVAAVAAYLRQELEIDRAITNAFVRDSFEDGDPASVLAEKTARTEAALRRQIQRAGQLEAPPQAGEVKRAFAAARRANLDYLTDVAAAIDARNQAALDQALRDGRAAATRAGRQLRRAASALQEQTQGEFPAG